MSENERLSSAAGDATGGAGAARAAGILLPVTALPADGAPTLADGFAFVDFLAEAGQRVWQMLPVGPVGASRSPYQGASAFAGNPAFVDAAAAGPAEAFDLNGAAYKRFLAENADWLDGYALFEAMRTGQRGRPLLRWPDELRNPSPRTLAELRDAYAEAMERTKIVQYHFFAQWAALKAYANQNGVALVGDLPFYVAEDSAEFWLSRDAFDVDADGRPASSGGVPPDGFSDTGQVWNVPVYAWDRPGRGRKAALALWRARLAQAARLYDGVRLDHFRGLADFYAFPTASDATAVENVGAACSRPKKSTKSAKIGNAGIGTAVGSSAEGAWRPGPGRAFTGMARREFPKLRIIAEDLGELSDAARALRAASGYPGMAVLQFAFADASPENGYLPHNIGRGCVCYTGTHDNNTLVGWARAASAAEVSFAARYLGLAGGGADGGRLQACPARSRRAAPTKGKAMPVAALRAALPAAVLRAALASRADLAVVPMQDWLGLGAEARMNKPATVGGRNWKWRLAPDALTPALAKRIREMTELYGR
jgi:4-alpha-glucanotransferase